MSSSNSGIMLYTVGTPNGHKVSIALEELKAVGAIPGYDYKAISFKDNEQKSDWFMKINPNGRIPAMTDKGKNIWESASMLLYLARVYDKDFHFHFQDEDEEQDMITQLMFLTGGTGPMQGQANHFFRYAPEKIQYGIDRYQNETRRLYKTYDGMLSGRKYLVGKGEGKYSMADICVFPWVAAHAWAGIDIGPYPNLKAWLDRIQERPAVKAGQNVPPKSETSNDPKEMEKKAKEASAWVMAGMKRDAEEHK